MFNHFSILHLICSDAKKNQIISSILKLSFQWTTVQSSVQGGYNAFKNNANYSSLENQDEMKIWTELN